MSELSDESRRLLTRREARELVRSYASDSELARRHMHFSWDYSDGDSVMGAEKMYVSPSHVLYCQSNMPYYLARQIVPDSWDVAPEEWRLRRV